MPKWDKRVIFGPKTNTFFFLNLLMSFFSKITPDGRHSGEVKSDSFEL